MVSHLVAEQRSALSSHLDELRAENAARAAAEEAKQQMEVEEEEENQKLHYMSKNEEHVEEELQILGHLEELHLPSLSTDILHQVIIYRISQIYRIISLIRKKIPTSQNFGKWSYL